MPIISIDQGIQLATAFVTLVGAYYVLKGSVKELKIAQEEVLRQVTALHKRMDHQSERLSEVEKAQVRFDVLLSERTGKGLTASQRFRMSEE